MAHCILHIDLDASFVSVEQAHKPEPFTPFFTPEKKVKGVGLGLAVSQELSNAVMVK
jgi:hypothetical protein